MEGPLYSSIRYKGKRPHKRDLSRVSLIEQEKHLMHNPRLVEEWSREEIKHAFYNDLKSLLKKDEIKDIIESLFELEQALSLFENSAYTANVNLPNLKTFYQQLAPILLRALWEIKNNEKIESEDEQKSNDIWKEAIRIAIEEEVYIWQEEILN